MPNSKKRKLSAILFADIVGYTALMQTNEELGSQMVQKFRNTLNEKVIQHQGQVIQYYGDGCLCTFDSAVDAMKCAKEVQRIFLSSPSVPVRIGLHSGDVYFEADNVYGDSVNIASRIESLGVAGAVLFSKQIKRHIANQTDFEIQSIGEFDFKNVDKTMEVFVLANEGLIIPKPSEIQGKGKATSSRKNKWLIPSLFGILLVAALAFWQLNTIDNNSLELTESHLSPTGTPLPAAVLEQRVAIIPIQNNTSNPELDILGKMAADWINRGLMEIEDAEVVSPYTVNQHLDAIGILPNNPQGKPSFSELTGARNFIQGTFYQEKEELLFLMELVDAISGKIQFKFPTIRGNAKDREGLITQLREHITGYWATRDIVDAKRINAPKYEAYKNYVLRLVKGVHDNNPLESIELDSTFYLARIHFLNNNRVGILGNNKVHFDFFDRHIAKLSNYEKTWVDYLRHIYGGNSLAAFNSLDKLRGKYPNDFRLNHECATVASELLYNDELALSIFESLPLKNINPKEIGEMYNYRLINQASSYINTNQLTKSKQLLERYPPFIDSKTYEYPYIRYREALSRNDTAQLMKWKKEIVNNSRSWPFFLILYSAGRDKELAEEILVFYQKNKSPVTALYFSNSMAYIAKQPKEVNLEKINNIPTFFQTNELLFAGLTYIEAGQTRQMNLILTALEKLTVIDYQLTARLGSGATYQVLGVLYTQMGQYEEALKQLRLAKKYGPIGRFQSDDKLSPLFDMPEFQKLIQPIWPAVKE